MGWSVGLSTFFIMMILGFSKWPGHFLLSCTFVVLFSGLARYRRAFWGRSQRSGTHVDLLRMLAWWRRGQRLMYDGGLQQW
ncbi:uncharacterized protein B0H64DRAFT_392426 [Chaetomium fimeti]|uniref:Uncharacterized protein n=1 Tax=Chaetomium fimeti TaxID=1854472 RepID=A0AAE0HJV9_9PEZI|nr:hypothetical protein B0H64DRAFT_392426 [Chaetomium fimeti]